MTAATIISDAEAKRIIHRLDGHVVGGFDCHPSSVFGHFASNGRIGAHFVWIAEEAKEPHRLDSEPDALWERRRLRWDLYRYVAHHGERPAVDGWSSLSSESTDRKAGE